MARASSRSTPPPAKPIATVRTCSRRATTSASAAAARAFESGALCPRRKRGEIVRQLGEELREHKDALGRLVTLEMGKILAEGEGEVQEMIDMCDFAVGLSRQLYGLTMHSERPRAPHVRAVAPAGRRRHHHRLQLPGRGLGLERRDRRGLRRHGGLEAVSSTTPLTAIAVQKIAAARLRAATACPAIFSLVVGRGADGRRADDRATARIPLISATGSTAAWAGTSARPSASRLGRYHPRAGRQQRASSSSPTPISTWRCAPSSSARSAPPASAAPPPAASSSTRPWPTT